MKTVRRLTDSCLMVTTDEAATMIDPGFHTFESGEIDLDSIGPVTRICITHEHGDHVNPAFVSWLIDRGRDVVVYSNEAVARVLEPHGIEVEQSLPDGLSGEDVLHEPLPNGARPPNRSFTVEDVLTHPGDSHQPTMTAPILALPLLAPWGSATAAVDFARTIGPRQIIPIHDFYLTETGRAFAARIARLGLEGSGIELLELGWGESLTAD
jgi:L-ascorbate metabolism protein UlaG (beta-lactamase superfamily)